MEYMVVMNQKINIVYEDNHVLVVEKPINIPVQADQSHDLDLLTILKADLKKRYQKPGNVYLGLVHRLDRPVGGIMVFAKTSKAASRLSEQVRSHQFQKEYYAVVLGKIEKQGHLEDNLLKDTKKNISYIIDFNITCMWSNVYTWLQHLFYSFKRKAFTY